MNQYLNHFLNSKGNIDLIFQDALNSFSGKSIRILEIGATRNLDNYSRMADGWSSLHYYSYIKKNGGSLTICDISESSLSNCKKLFENLTSDVDVKFLLADGTALIDDSYDLIYLDGGDDPKDMVTQLSKINLNSQKVLCDDFHTKGSIARNIFSNCTLYKWEGHSHEMAFYRQNYKGVIFCSTIQ
jgi:predicted O-methyltransferase YrrM